MLSFSFYLLKVIICSAVLFGYYWFFLRNKIFHSYNRFYLLAIVMLSLALPVMRINVWHKANEQQTSIIKMLQVVNSTDEYMDEVVIYSSYNHVSKEQILSILYVAVCAVFFLLMLQALFRIWNLITKNPVTRIENINFIKTNAKGTPFSFFKFIFWNEAINIESRTGNQVFKHEVAHVQEKHSYDKLFINIVLIFFWCNPFFWLIRKELNMIHEFIADKKAIEDGDTADFAAMILQATYPQYRFPLANNFFYSPIKRRLLMLTKQQKNKVSYYSRLLVLPVAVIVFAAFTLKAKTYSDKKTNKAITVVIDAGHGGTDNGAIAADGTKEKDINLVLAQKIKALNTNPDIHIILTRESDIYQSPQEKAMLAQKAGADLFISIHISVAAEKRSMESGMDVYVSKNNFANSNASKLLASGIITVFQKNYGLKVQPNPIQRETGIWVLQESKCPAILIEAGNLSNEKDIVYLKTDRAVETFAGNVLKAIESYSMNTDLLNSNISAPAVASSSINFSVDVKNTDSLYLKSNEFKTKALIIIDSKEIGNLGYDHIEKNILLYDGIVIYSPAKAINIYGDKGNNGAIKLATRKPVTNESPIQGPIEHESYATIDHDFYFTGFEQTDASIKKQSWIWDQHAFAEETRPLFILNGKEVTDLKSHNISNENIADVRILTAKTAMATYGDKAKNGVIIINTTKSAINANSLIVLDGKIYDQKNWNEVMSENDFKAIDRMEVLEKDKAIEKFGSKGKNGAIIATTRKIIPTDPSITLSGINGPRINTSQLKNIKELKCSSEDYEVVSATIYFTGKGFPNVAVTQLNNGSLKNIESYFANVGNGTTVVFDNVRIQKKDGSGLMEIPGKAFEFYGEADTALSENDKIFSKVETEPDFPGGKNAWQEYLIKNLDASMPIKEGWKPGTYKIVVQFIVDTDGSISDVSTTDYPKSRTSKQCLDLIKNGPKWVSANQNGKKVKAYKKQPITFVVSEQ